MPRLFVYNRTGILARSVEMGLHAAAKWSGRVRSVRSCPLPHERRGQPQGVRQPDRQSLMTRQSFPSLLLSSFPPAREDGSMTHTRTLAGARRATACAAAILL